MCMEKDSSSKMYIKRIVALKCVWKRIVALKFIWKRIVALKCGWKRIVPLKFTYMEKDSSMSFFALLFHRRPWASDDLLKVPRPLMMFW